MGNFIRQLLDLQALESSVLDIERQQALCVRNLEALRELKKKAGAVLKESEVQLASKKCDYQAQELELKRLEDLLVQQKTKRLFVKKAEEFNMLEAANEKCEQQLSDLQDRMLLVLEEIERQEGLVQTQKKEYETQRVQWEEQEAEIERRNHALRTRLDEAQKQQELYESALNGAHYRAYVNLRKCGKPMPRVVPVKDDGKCGGCFLALSRETIDGLQKDDVLFCEHCGRILYKLEVYD